MGQIWRAYRGIRYDWSQFRDLWWCHPMLAEFTDQVAGDGAGDSVT